jgi:hypothetical protein
VNDRANRFAECHQRVAEGCGGRHERGPDLVGQPLWVWVCCEECPLAAELNPWRQKPPPLTSDELERDCWASWWLAHAEIGEAVRAGLRPLPALFVPREREAAE